MNIPDNPRGWFMSEKLDGVRALWTGRRLLSRNGRDFRPPAWFTRGLPPVRLDGEIWMGRGTFPDLVGAIQRHGSDWPGAMFQIFDMAALRVPIECRLAELARLPLPQHAQLVTHRPCTGWRDLDRTEAAVVAAGGEGLCLRAPGSAYRPHGFAKVKRLFPDLNRSQLD